MAPVTKPSQQTAGKEDQKVKITLYWLEKSRAQRILWLLEEVKANYDIKTYKRQNMLAPAEFKEVHPLGKAPLISIESETLSKPLVLAESGTIIEYLAENFGPWLIPKQYQDGKEGQIGGETESWLRYRYYMHFAEGSHMPLLLIALLLNNIKNNSPFFIRPLASMITSAVETKFLFPNLDTQFAFLEGQIASSPNGGQYLCGPDLTAADIFMSFPLSAAKGRAGFSKEKHPKLWAYVDRIEALDASKRAVQKIIDIEGSYDPTL